MKRTNKITALILALALAVFALVSCGGDGDSEGSITLVLGLETPVEYEVDLSKITVDNGLFSVLDYLASEEKLTYVMPLSTEWKRSLPPATMRCGAMSKRALRFFHPYHATNRIPDNACRLFHTLPEYKQSAVDRSRP